MRLLLALTGFIFLLPAWAEARYTQISVEGFRFCGLLESGEIECTAAFNPEPAGFQDIPDDAFSALAVSDSYTCAINLGGALDCWGTVSDGETTPPVFDSPVVELDQSIHHACALDSVGVVKCWGQDVHGQATAPDNVTDFVDVDTFGFFNSCGVRSNGEVLCWGRSSDIFLPVYFTTPDLAPIVDIEFTPSFSTDIGCGLRDDGTVDCWRSTSSIVVSRFRDGPYRKVFPLTQDQTFVACALTVTGNMDCADQRGDIVRLPDTFQDADLSDPENFGFSPMLYGYTTEGRLVAVSQNITGVHRRIIDIVNGEIEMPAMEITGGEYYGGSVVEIFFDGFRTENFQLRFDTQIFRDGVLIATTDNRGSYVDRTVEPGSEPVYTVRAVHQFGQVGAISNARLVTAHQDIGVRPDDDLAPARPFSPQNLRGEVYWHDVELFWDRDLTGTVQRYEIRRDGALVDTTRGTSWYDNATEDGQSYQYDVLAIGRSEEILGISSVHMQIGIAECR